MPPYVSLLLALLALVLQLLALCSCRVLPLPSERTFRLCGKNLSDTLTLVCNGEFNFLSSPGGGDYHPRRRGVADECCETTCSLATLQQYCKNKSHPLRLSAALKSISNDIRSHAKDERPHSDLLGKDKASRARTPQVRHGAPGSNTNKQKRGGRRRRRKLRKAKVIRRTCVYESFARLLLRLHDEGVRIDLKMNDSLVPSLQVGTIAPDTFGGNPVVVPTRRKTGK